MKPEKNEFVKFLRMRKLHYDVNLKANILNYIKENTNKQNVTLYYQISDIFDKSVDIKNLAEATLHFAQSVILLL